jgi:hypothetical protein
MPRSAREFVADYIAAMNRHDVQGVVSFFAPASPPPGRRCASGASFMRVRDSLAVWNTDYWDINTMRRQIEAGSG